MADLKSIPGERVCDLVDGRLKDDACAQALSALLSDPQEVQTWYAFHVVGDCEVRNWRHHLATMLFWSGLSGVWRWSRDGLL
jgi:hypothetical protein